MKANTGMSYIPLHVHTEYSLLDGMSTVKELFDRANELRMPAIAITDHGTMAGVKDFFNHAKRFYPDIKPILGNEIYFAGCPNHNQKEGVLTASRSAVFSVITNAVISASRLQ